MTMAHQIARAASAFEQQLTGHPPTSVTVVLCEDTVVITLHGALSLAEKAMSQSAGGAAQVKEFHRQLFNNSCDLLRQEIENISGVSVGEATAEVATTTGTVVQLFLLGRRLPTEFWSGSGRDGPDADVRT